MGNGLRVGSLGLSKQLDVDSEEKRSIRDDFPGRTEGWGCTLRKQLGPCYTESPSSLRWECHRNSRTFELAVRREGRAGGVNLGIIAF